MATSHPNSRMAILGRSIRYLSNVAAARTVGYNERGSENRGFEGKGAD